MVKRLLVRTDHRIGATSVTEKNSARLSISHRLDRRHVKRRRVRQNAPGFPASNPKPTGETTMTTSEARPVPDGMHTVTPHLVCAGAAEAIEFYKKAFNAAEVVRLPGPQGKLLHACLRIGDSSVMLVDEFPDCGALGPKSRGGSPVTIHLQVEDVDVVVAQAVTAGAKITMPVADMFWGDRYGTLEDPFGHSWSVATHRRDVSPEEMQQAAQKMCA